MTIHTHVYVEPGGDVTVEMRAKGEVIIKIYPGPDAHVGWAYIYIYEASTPELYADLVKRFELEVESLEPTETP